MHARSIKSIFLAARRLRDPIARESFLADACGDDRRLRDQVLELLAAADRDAPNPLDHAVASFAWTRNDSAAAADASETPLPLPTIDKYQLLERLGEGGMGVVYQARQTEPVSREVALKVIKPGMDTREVIARFDAERQTLAMMDHPHIARIFDAGVTCEGRPFFAMELVRGVPIDEYADAARLSLTCRLKLFMDVCRAVQHAHQKGVIHRDLKPTNILIASPDGVPMVKVIDFGIAKMLDQDGTDQLQTHVTRLVGTPAYMSPEQADVNAQGVDTRSDVYSLGVLLYKLLTGTTPFERDALNKAGPDGVRRMICDMNLSRPSSRLSTLDARLASTQAVRCATDVRRLVARVRGELDWIVMRALEKDRNRRYQTAAELAADVQRHLDGEPVSACPPSLAYRARKLVARNRLAISVGAVISLTLLVSSIVSVQQAIEARRAQRLSEARQREVEDLLEAARLQTALRAFGERNLVLGGKLVAPENLSPADSHSSHLGALGKLLRSTLPVPTQTYEHPAAVQEFDVSADGRRMISVDAAGGVRLWDLDKTSSARLLGRHVERADAVAFAPDGRRAASGSRRGHIWIWDLERGAVEHRLGPLDAGIEALAWSPDGRHLAGGARYSSVAVYDTAAAGKPLLMIPNDHRHESLRFSPDGRELFVPTRTGIAVWDLASRQRKRVFSTGSLRNVRALSLAGPQHQWLVVGERFSESLLVLDHRTGRHVDEFHVGASYAQSLAASPDGRWLAAAYPRGHCQLIQLDSATGARAVGTRYQEWSAHRPQDARATVRWLADGIQFLSGGADGNIYRWNRHDVRPVQVLQPPIPPDRVFARGARGLVYYVENPSSATELHVRIDPAGRSVPGPSYNSPFPVEAYSISAPGGLVAVAGTNKVAVLSLDTGRTIHAFPSPISQPWYVAISADQSTVGVTSSEQTCVWRTSDHWNSCELVATRKVSSAVAPVFADHNQTLILCAKRSDATDLVEWDLQTGEILRTHDFKSYTEFCVSRDSRLLAAERRGEILVIERATGNVQFRVDHLSEPIAMQFTVDDRVLISVHEDGRIRAWHVPTGQFLGILFEPPQYFGVARGVSLSEDGRMLIGWYADRLVIIGGRRFMAKAP